MAITDNLLSYWKLDESSGNASDSVASNTLTNVNTVTYGTGKINNGADFGSTNSDRLLGNASNLGITGGAVSISVWFKISTQPSSGDTQSIIRLSENTNKTDVSIRYINTGGTYTLEFGRGKNGVGDNTIVRTGQLTTDVWYHAVLSYNATTLYGYFNGTEVSNTSASGSGSGANPNYLTVGGHYNSALSYFFPFKGLADEIGIWTRGITSGEVTELYNGGSGVQYPFANAYTLACAVGSFALTGINIGLLYGRKLAMEVGTFVLTGIDVSFNKGYGMIAGVGSFILTGIAVTLRLRHWTKATKSNTDTYTQASKSNTSTWTKQSKS